MMERKKIKFSKDRFLAVFAAITWGFTMWSRTAFNYYTDELGISATKLGIVNFMTSVGSMTGAVVLSRIADRRNARMQTLGTGLFFAALMQLVISGSYSFPMLLVGRLLMGFGLGCVYSLTQAIVEHASMPETRSSNAGIVENGEAVISNMFGPTVIVWLIARFGWRTANRMLIMPVLLLAAIWLFFARKGESQEKADKEALRRKKVSYAEVLKDRNMRLCLVLGVLILTNIWTMYIYGPMYWKQEANFEETKMSMVMTLNGLVAILACFTLPTFSNRFGRKKVTELFAILNTAAYMVMFLFPGSMAGFVLFVAFGGSACTLSMFFMALIPTESVKACYAATSISLVNAASEILGGALSPLLTGSISDTLGVRFAMLLAGICMGMAALLIPFLKETAPRLKE